MMSIDQAARIAINEPARQQLQALLRMKVAANRRKDAEGIRLIEEALRKTRKPEEE